MITKKELSTILHTLQIPVGEGEHFLEAKDAMPKLAYWEYVWDDEMASGDDYEEIVTYQVSFVATKPRHRKLLELKALLNSYGLHPTIYHEYVAAGDAPGHYHSYFSVDVAEGLTNESEV